MLLRHARIGIHILHVTVHRRRLLLAVGGSGPWLYLISVHSRGAVLLIRRNSMPAHPVVGRRHVLVVRRARHAVLARHLATRGWYASLGGLCLSRVRALGMTGLLARYDVDQEVEHVTLGQGRGNVGSLQCPALVLFGMDPGAHGELGDEYVASLGEEDGGLSRDHLHLRVGLHDLLDAGERQLVYLVIMLVGLEVVNGLLPVGCQDILELTV